MQGVQSWRRVEAVPKETNNCDDRPRLLNPQRYEDKLMGERAWYSGGLVAPGGARREEGMAIAPPLTCLMRVALATAVKWLATGKTVSKGFYLHREITNFYPGNAV